MELWFTEEHTPNVRFSLKVKQHLYREKSLFQQIDVIDTFEFGRMLLLDGKVMLSQRDEFAYHEMITHIPALTHPQPRKVLIIGGGEGGTVRELLRYSSIEAIELVEIDDKVVEAAKLFFPEMAGGLDHPKVTVFFQDGIEFVKQHKNKYDLALIDSIDPVGPAEGLFEKPFFENVHRCLKEDGIMCAQAESTLYGAEISRSMMVKLKTLYPIVLPYYSFIPTYPSGQWLFVLASKKYHPLVDFRSEDAESLQRKLKYYNSSIHQSSFALPSCLARFYEP